MNNILEKIAIFIGVVATIVVSYWLGQQSYSWMPVTATKEAQHDDDPEAVVDSTLKVKGIVGLRIAMHQ